MEAGLRFTLDDRDVTLVTLHLPERDLTGRINHKIQLLVAVDTDRLLTISAKKRRQLDDDGDDSWNTYLTDKCGAMRHDHPVTGAPAFLRTQMVYNKKFKPVWIPESRAHFHNGNMHGQYKSWHANGKKHEEAYYTHNALHDKAADIPAYRKWTKSGALCRLEHYANGAPVNIAMNDNLPPFANKYFADNGTLVRAYDAETKQHYHGRSLDRFVALYRDNGGDITHCRTQARPFLARLAGLLGIAGPV